MSNLEITKMNMSINKMSIQQPPKEIISIHDIAYNEAAKIFNEHFANLTYKQRMNKLKRLSCGNYGLTTTIVADGTNDSIKTYIGDKTYLINIKINIYSDDQSLLKTIIISSAVTRRNNEVFRRSIS